MQAAWRSRRRSAHPSPCQPLPNLTTHSFIFPATSASQCLCLVPRRKAAGRAPTSPARPEPPAAPRSPASAIMCPTHQPQRGGGGCKPSCRSGRRPAACLGERTLPWPRCVQHQGCPRFGRSSSQAARHTGGGAAAAAPPLPAALTLARPAAACEVGAPAQRASAQRLPDAARHPSMLSVPLQAPTCALKPSRPAPLRALQGVLGAVLAVGPGCRSRRLCWLVPARARQ